MTLQLTRRKFTVEEYHRMASVGILTEGDRVELIDGEIVEMPPIGPEHSAAVDDFTVNFVRRYADVARVRVQNPLRIDERNELQPDIALVRLRSDG
ncbi:MAG TPA: Uma2 family endonuclease, partial [Dehalococcoidia bacterium]|nr:Uma2 family endonuclease [Dehalococcoidia bacterium]